ncbi:MAG: Gfo/Idh/MocA family oxidoreductase [Candidatus Kaiserbacteria bacterium]|nr:MAG: Gfo/Idh/MocA family oxidoreductase [Candidatus Kaiserbacteria bacterium]
MVKLALIGHGRWGKNIENTLARFDDVSLVIVARGGEVPEDVDAAIVATPAASHSAVALPLVKKGIATFIEKPLATSVADAKALLVAAERSRALVHVGHVHLHNPAFLKVLELIPRLGELRSIVCEGLNDRPRSDTSVLWDWLPHDLSMMLALFPEKKVRVRAVGSSMEESDFFGTAFARYLFDNIPIFSFVSWESRISRRVLTFTGTEGTLIFDDRAEKKLALFEAGVVSYPAYDKEPPLAREMRVFVDAVGRKENDATSLKVGVRIVELIAAAEESAESKSREISC